MYPIQGQKKKKFNSNCCYPEMVIDQFQQHFFLENMLSNPLELDDPNLSEMESIFDSSPDSPESGVHEQFDDFNLKSATIGVTEQLPTRRLSHLKPISLKVFHHQPIPHFSTSRLHQVSKLHQPSQLHQTSNYRSEELKGHVLNPKLTVKTDKSPRNTISSTSNPTAFSTMSAQQRIPPATAQATRKHALMQSREMTLAQIKQKNVLKVKIFFQDEVLAVKLRKDLLSGIKELADVTKYKLLQRHNFAVRDLKLSLKFADSQLQPVILCGGSNPFASMYEDICMDYIHSKSKILISASLK